VDVSLDEIVARDEACGSGDLPDSRWSEYQSIADRRELLALLRETRDRRMIPAETERVIFDLAREALTERDRVAAAGWVVNDLPHEEEVRSWLGSSASGAGRGTPATTSAKTTKRMILRGVAGNRPPPPPDMKDGKRAALDEPTP
jgi:hypothetical protein